MAVRTLNKATLIGYLGRDPELRYLESGKAYCNLNVVTSYQYQDDQGEWQTKKQYHHVVAWGRRAEVCAEYLHKGSQIYVDGRIDYSKWTAKDGTRRQTCQITMGTMIMLTPPGR